MFFDWLQNEGWIVLNWWLLVTVAGLTALPLVTRLLSGLPDRGYTLARPAGVLLISFVFWLLASLGFLDNSPGSVILAWLMVLTVALIVYFRPSERFSWLASWRDYWRENRTVIITAEVLFVVLLLGWSTVRAYQHGLDATEKMMDLAFMSAVQRSETFPPNDPWLSGYAISYYYFGYVMGATLSKMSGVWSTTGFNMHIAMLFALTGLAAFGVAYNLVRARARILLSRDTFDARPARSTAILVGLLATVFVVLLGNFHAPLVELPYRAASVDDSYLRFWDVKDRDTLNGRAEALDMLDPQLSTLGYPNYWWWFDASRVVTERDLNGQRVNEVIDEFPQFSFLLADSHPHVMTLPYVLLAMGLALNTLLSTRRPDTQQILFYGLCAGALVFLNTWDAPIYITLMVAADVLRRIMKAGRLTALDWIEVVTLGGALLAITFIAYFPFLVGFRSQLGGVLPNVLHPTRIQQLFVMFGPFFLILLFFLGVELWRGRQGGRFNWGLGAAAALGILLVLVGALLALVVGGRLNEQIYAQTSAYVTNNGGWSAVITEVLLRRLLRILTPILLLFMIVVVVARLFPRLGFKRTEMTDDSEASAVTYPASTGFALLLVAVGVMLVLIPEFVYLRDNFGTRMNTVFKFYYQTWITFSIASAYAVYSILAEVEARPATVTRVAFAAVLMIALAGGLVYPVLGIHNRMFLEEGSAGRTGSTPTLDGGLSVVARRGGPGDYEALMCLNTLVEGDDVVVAEATEPSYDFGGAGRTGALTGIPTVIGWYGHQAQWRGSDYGRAVGSRVDDIRVLFSDPRMDTAMPIIDRYSIDYIVFGPVERQYYGAGGEDKFAQNFETVCSSDVTRVYRVQPVTVTQR
ncbi:MAG: DUF2298 domain-containing protein [bacterium]|nr:DUF2298 domain-containing protein [bacterium]